MTVIMLDSGAKLEVREGKLFLKEGDSYERVERIEKLIEILKDSENIDIAFKLSSEVIYFEIELEEIRIECPVFIIPLLHEFKRFKLNDDERTLCSLVPTKKFKKEKIANILNNAFFAWLIIDFLYPLGRLIEYFTDSEIFVKNRLEGEDVFNDFQTRLDESKIILGKFENGSVSKCSELVVFAIDKINELLDFFFEFIEILNKIEELSKSEIIKIPIFSEFLRRLERLSRDFLGLMSHVISRLIFGKKLVSLQLFSILTDKTGELTYETIALTARNIFDVDNLFKLEQDLRRNLLHSTSKWGEAKKFKKLRNISPLSHCFKPIDLSEYTVNRIVDILSPFYNFLINLLYDNLEIIKKRVESEEDEKLQNEIALVGVSAEEVQTYIYQLKDVLSMINRFTPSEFVGMLKYLRNLYLNLFLLLSFFEEEEVKGR